MLEFLKDNYVELGVALLALLGGLQVALATIAPLTENKADDKAAKALGKVVGLLRKIPFLRG